MKYNNLRDDAYRIASEHGFYDEKLSAIHYLAHVTSELGEAFNAYRLNKQPDLRRFARLTIAPISLSDYFFRLRRRSSNKKFFDAFERTIKDSVADELADACIRIFDLAGCTNTDLDVKVNKPKLASESFPEMVFEVCQELMIYSAYSLTRSLLLIYQIAELRDVDLDWHIELKMKYNSTRPRLHNKQY